MSCYRFDKEIHSNSTFGATMGSNQCKKRQRKVMIAKDIAANREEAKHQRERRERIKQLNNVGASSSTIVSEEENIKDTINVEEGNTIEPNLGASSNPLLDTGMSSQPHVYSHEQIGDLVEVGYSLNQTPNESKTQIETEIETEIETPIEIENQLAIEIHNVDVNMETPIEKETCLNDNEMNEYF